MSSAGAVRVPVAQFDETAGPLRDRLAGQRFDSAAHVVVCDGDTVVGIVRIEDLLAATPAVRMAELMDKDPPTTTSAEPDEVAAWKAVRHGESALAIVDGSGRLVDVIPPRRMVEVLLEEHDQDLARLGGYLASTESARHAIEEPVAPRLVHRLPWLLVGLAGSVLAALVVEHFAHQLEERLLIAFFVPGIVYMADAVGTQTETLIIRGLSVGVPIRHIVRRELVTGLLIGVALALAFIPVGLVLWHSGSVVIAVALALLAACSTATIVAMALPWAISRLGHDPAFGSGPLATVIQDLLSLLIYFGIASAIVS